MIPYQSRNRLTRRQKKIRRAKSMIRWGFPEELSIKFADNRQFCRASCHANLRKIGILPLHELRDLDKEMWEDGEIE